MPRWNRTTFLCAVLVVSGGLLAGCEKSEQGHPTSHPGPVPTTTTAASSTAPTGTSLPFAGAPKVMSPLDADKFLRAPCLALTSSQAARLGVGAGRERRGNLGMVCDWSGVDSSAAV